MHCIAINYKMFTITDITIKSTLHIVIKSPNLPTSITRHRIILLVKPSLGLMFNICYYND